MNKKTLIEEIAKKSDLSKAKIEETLNLTIDGIKKIVKNFIAAKSFTNKNFYKKSK